MLSFMIGLFGVLYNADGELFSTAFPWMDDILFCLLRSLFRMQGMLELDASNSECTLFNEQVSLAVE